jgi:MFS family permease
VQLYSKWELLKCLLFAPPQNIHTDTNADGPLDHSETDDTSHHSTTSNDDEDEDYCHDVDRMHTTTSHSSSTFMQAQPTPLRVQWFGSVFILAIIVLSFGRVIVESLIFLYFEQLGSSFFIMGCTVVLTVVFEIPVFAISASMLQYFGTSNLLRIAMICYIVRVIGYSFIPNGHVEYALILEPLHGVTYACSQTAVVDFVHQRTPRGYEATGQSFVYIFRGFGSVLGLIIGGYMTDVIGSRMVYRIAALIVSIGCLSLSAVSSNVKTPTVRQRASTSATTRIRTNTNSDKLNHRPKSIPGADDENIEMIRSMV